MGLVVLVRSCQVGFSSCMKPHQSEAISLESSLKWMQLDHTLFRD